MKWKCRLDDVFGGAYELRLYFLGDGGRRNAVEFVVKEVDQGVVMPPTVITTVEEMEDGVGTDIKGFLQAVTDCAFEQGIVPTQLPDYRGEMKATKYHLEDMRRVAKVPPPPE